MPTVNADVGGFANSKKHIATLRLQSPNRLDVEIVADGTKTVLDLVKETANEISSLLLPDAPLPAEWVELGRQVPDGTTLTISIGVLTKYNDPA